MIGNIIEWQPAGSFTAKARVIDVISINTNTQYLVHVLDGDKDFLKSLGNKKVTVVSPTIVCNMQTTGICI